MLFIYIVFIQFLGFYIGLDQQDDYLFSVRKICYFIYNVLQKKIIQLYSGFFFLINFLLKFVQIFYFQNDWVEKKEEWRDEKILNVDVYYFYCKLGYIENGYYSDQG